MRRRYFGRAINMCALVLLVSFASASIALGDEITTPNGRMTEAQPLGSTGAVHNGAISADGDVDWYYFYVPGPADVTFTVTGGGYARVDKYEAAALDYVWNGQDSSFTMQLEPGLYYVQVEEYWPNSYPDSYSVRVQGGVSTATNTPTLIHRTATWYNEIYEYSTQYSSAQAVPNYANNVGTIGSYGDVDWYKFKVTSTSDVQLGVSGQVYAHVYSDPNGDPIFDPSANTVLARFEPGTYYLKIDSWSGWTYPQEYTFAVRGLGVPTTPYAKLAVPWLSVTSPRAYGAFSVQQTITPKHTASTTSSATKLFYYRFEGGRWAYKTYQNAHIWDYNSTSSKYQRWASLPPGNWAVRAYHSDLSHFPSYSGWRYFTVQ